MIIVMKPYATPENIQAVEERLQELGFKTIINPGDVMTVIAAIGDKTLMDNHAITSMQGVKELIRIKEPYKLASRRVKKDDTVISFDNGVTVGGANSFCVMAGPCSLDERDKLLPVADAVKQGGAQFLRGGAFKPRTSPYDFQGLEEEGLKLLAEARDNTGLLIITEVMDTAEVDLVAQYADVLQVGARNMQNFKLLKAVGKQPKPVMLKRGLSATVREFLLAAEYILYHGNDNVMLCERGIRSFDSTFTRNVLDLAIIPVLRKLTHLPIIVDPSHATGHRFIIPPMAHATVFTGAHGLMCEVHADPDTALSDGAQSLTIEQYLAMMDQLNQTRTFYQQMEIPPCLDPMVM